MGRVCLPLTGDATAAAGADAAVARTIAEFGHIDTLINCVGDAIRKPVAQLPGSATPGMTEAEWRSIVDINLTEAFQGCRAVGPHLLDGDRAASSTSAAGRLSGGVRCRPPMTPPKRG